MKKLLYFFSFLIAIILAVGIGMYSYANAPKEKVFVGIDGKEITVHSDNFSAMDTMKNNAKDEGIKAGDIIGSGTEKELVIGVSADGQFITMPLADFESEQD